MKVVIAVVALISLSACAHLTPPPSIACSSKAQCDSDWSKSQAWVATHSAYRVQVVSDALIQTEGPRTGDPHYAFTIVREIQPDGSGTIQMHGRCGNMFGCTTSPQEEGSSLQAYLRP